MKLLLVEDDEKIAAAVRRGLEAEGFTVEVADDGHDGLWMATEGTYDVIVLDLMLPGRNGYQVCAELRAGGDWTPILVLTAKDGELDEAEALDTGADDYLTKPFSFPVLVARLARSCPPGGRRGTRRPCAVGDLRLDPAARRVLAGRGRDRASPPGSSTCSSSSCAAPAQVLSKARHPRRRVGRTTSTATPTSSRSTSAACAARSTSRSGGARSRPSAAAGYRLVDDALTVLGSVAGRRAERPVPHHRGPSWWWPWWSSGWRSASPGSSGRSLTENLDESLVAAGRRPRPTLVAGRRVDAVLAVAGDDDLVAQVVGATARWSRRSDRPAAGRPRRVAPTARTTPTAHR